MTAPLSNLSQGDDAGDASASVVPGKPGPPASLISEATAQELALAASLKAKVKQLGLEGPQANHARRRLRDSAILAALAAGEPPVDLAKEFEITTRQIRRIVKGRANAATGLDARPIELAEELLRSYRDSIADLEAMSRRYLDSHPAVALGAKRSAIETREKFVVLLEALGKLPDNLELFRSEVQMRRISDQMIEALGRWQAGDASMEEVLEVFARAGQSSSVPGWDATVDAVPELEAGE